MPYDRFLIAPFESGLQTNLRPWLIPQDAFASLRNANVFRGRVRKRFGQTLTGTGSSGFVTAPLFSRLRIPLEGGSGVGITNGSGNASGTVPGDIFTIGQLFSIGDEIFTVVALGTPAALLSTAAGVTGTFNTTTGAYAFTGATPTTQIYFYTAEPVMGINQYEIGPINNQPTYAFDTQFAYVFAGGSWIRSGTDDTPIWHGNDLNFYWITNWSGFNASIYDRNLFVSNFQVTNPNGAPVASDDPIWTFDGTTWSIYTPIFLVAGDFVQTARIILPFKGRLLLLNTIETNAGATQNINFQFRARFSAFASPFSAAAWLEQNQVGAIGAGFIDASTDEEIIGAEFIKDRLIVFFERSTWEIAYTGNAEQPFEWQKINTELGSESTFSSVPFDKAILAIGNTGVHACNGANVERIDTKIPDQVFQIVDKNLGVQRVYGIRDFFSEMVYWTFPSIDANRNDMFPTKVLVYNYQNSSWSLNDDCITAFGYFEQQTDLTWATSQTTWQESNFTWSSGINQAQFRQVIAGNQQGFIFIINSSDDAGVVSRNAPVMQITNMVNTGTNITLTIINHTLNIDEYIALERAQGITFVSSIFLQNPPIIQVINVIDANTILAGIESASFNFTGTYIGAGTVTRVSNIGILSKQWNPYIKEGKDVYLAKIDFGVQKTTNGEITVDYFPSSTELSMIEAGIATISIVGNNILETSPYALYPLEQQQNRLWHAVYFQSQGESIQIFMSLNDQQMRTPAITWSDFELEGMVLSTQRTSNRLE